VIYVPVLFLNTQNDPFDGKLDDSVIRFIPEVVMLENVPGAPMLTILPVSTDVIEIVVGREPF
jgi:hypothetical protein